MLYCGAGALRKSRWRKPGRAESGSKLPALQTLRDILGLRTRAAGEWFSLSAFGGEGRGEEAHPH